MLSNEKTSDIFSLLLGSCSNRSTPCWYTSHLTSFLWMKMTKNTWLQQVCAQSIRTLKSCRFCFRISSSFWFGSGMSSIFAISFFSHDTFSVMVKLCVLDTCFSPVAAYHGAPLAGQYQLFTSYFCLELRLMWGVHTHESLGSCRAPPLTYPNNLGIYSSRTNGSIHGLIPLSLLTMIIAQSEGISDSL